MNGLTKLFWLLSISAALHPTACGGAPVSIFEDFRGNPATNGWMVFGDSNLFMWNPTNRNLEVTWDSSKPNSYFYKPLGRTLTRSDYFDLYIDLRLRDIAIGTTPGRPYTFQIAIGLLNFQQATNGGFLRGTGFDSPNLFEFNYFPDSGFGATISPTIISSNNHFATTFILQEITTNDLFQIVMRSDTVEQALSVAIYRNGEAYAKRQFVYPANFTGFSVDTVAVVSYSDEGQFPDFAGSIIAHGTVEYMAVTTGQVPVELRYTGRFENGNWRMDFDAAPGWFYVVDRTSDFHTAISVGSYTSTNHGRATIVHTNPPSSQPQFYRLIGRRL